MRNSFWQTWKSRLSSGWSFMRILRLVLGAIAGVQAVLATDVVLGLLSGILLVQGLLNVGCCGANGCDTNQSFNKQRSTKAPLEDITFNEVK